jgi:murein DD-endopeptidase MepM/ murein hydrolase activator NlpD
MHKGVDFAAPSGTPVHVSADGVVRSAGRHGGYGNLVAVRHAAGIVTKYAHLSRIADGVKPGAAVRQGMVIGYVGSTGFSTGPHLHYEVLRQGVAVNPLAPSFASK